MGLGYCNITKCCTEVCPEHIKITDNAIIPLKERVVDAHYDPVAWLGRKIRRKDQALVVRRRGPARALGVADFLSEAWFDEINRSLADAGAVPGDEAPGPHYVVVEFTDAARVGPARDHLRPGRDRQRGAR